MQLTLVANAPAAASSVRVELQKTTALLEGTEDSPHHFSANLMRSLAEHRGPRHHHDFDQVRFPIEGEFVYAKDKVLPAGWVGYFPEGTYYGPQFRGPGLVMFYAEFGGASGCGHLSRGQRKRAKEILNSRGSIAKGMYTYTDDAGVTRVMDQHEAMGEVIRGKREYPAPRYDEIITMNPASYNWMPAADSPGISHKWLGSFNERGTRIGFIRIEPGAVLKAGLHSAPELLFLSKGSVIFRDQACPLHSALAFEAFEGPAPITAAEPSEFLCIQLPTFPS